MSLIGTWMQQIAMSWLVYRLTGSPALLGLIGFVTMAPMFFVTSVAGVFVDRWNRRRLLLLTNLFAMIQAAILGVLTLTGHIAVWHIFVLGFCLGFVNAFDMPTRQSFVIDMVEGKEDLNNAIALNSAMFNGARLVGPALAGLTVAAFGEGVCFLINSLSFLAIILALLAMKIKPRAEKAANRPFEGFKEGYRYVFGFLPVRYCILLLALMNLIGMQYSTLMPVFAKDVLHGGAHTLGFLVSASGIGALLSAFYFASRRSVVGLERFAAIAPGLFGCSNMVFSFSRSVTLSLFTMVVSGVGMMTALLTCNTIIQIVVEEDKRGRVMSFHAMASVGTMPFGSLIAGIVAAHLGAPHAVLISAGCCVVGSFFFARKVPLLRSAIRPVYGALGILNEMPAEAP
jgi:MFS family permease